MKTKKLCMMIVITMAFTVSINAFADCGNCEEAKPAKCEKAKAGKCEKAKAAKCEKAKAGKCCKQKSVKKVEVKKEDEDIPLSQVPKNIKKIARKAVKGIKFTEAELEDGNYELEGYVGDVEYEIEITPEGKIIKIEKEDKDKDDDNEEEFDD